MSIYLVASHWAPKGWCFRNLWSQGWFQELNGWIYAFPEIPTLLCGPNWTVTTMSNEVIFNHPVFHFRPRQVPRATLRFSHTWGLGGAALVLMAQKLVTGIPQTPPVRKCLFWSTANCENPDIHRWNIYPQRFIHRKTLNSANRYIHHCLASCRHWFYRSSPALQSRWGSSVQPVLHYVCRAGPAAPRVNGSK